MDAHFRKQPWLIYLSTNYIILGKVRPIKEFQAKSGGRGERGRSKNTFPTYTMAISKLWVHSIEVGTSVFRWNEGKFAGHLVHLDSNDAYSNMLK